MLFATNIATRLVEEFAVFAKVPEEAFAMLRVYRSANDLPKVGGAMRVTAIVGTRPQLIKLAALRPYLSTPIELTVVDTGQHHDESLAGQIYRDLRLGAPDIRLGAQTGLRGEDRLRATVRELDRALEKREADLVLVFGDTDSTLAGALAAQARGIDVAHVEAGLRSGDLEMPEERNRIAVDRIASLRLCTSGAAASALHREGLGDGNVVVGDLMADLVARSAPAVRDLAGLDQASHRIGRQLQSGGFLYATLHRADVREPSRLRKALALLESAADATGLAVLFAAHPGTSAAILEHEIDVPDGIDVIPPVGYFDSLALAAHAAAVMTDSGGLQREAVWLNTPTLILRETTEWPELLHPAGSSLLVGVAPSLVVDAFKLLGVVSGATAVAARASHPLPAGGAAEAIRAALIARHLAR